ncbi:unnamed protein product [Didymodactylos carnosus]|uniref:AB hydrolase-1 domain-containing protein n=1 Tax=Didymodactylos carnosus TaxID=1234261 RepID=A0A813XA12_9BILA|nr:unnamed protein product [Didymodactylos carnosus]CAF1132242.1 unnamed protein product [Didymodactylos carnosus]CAF3654390.1 unnamed protein product [Didymodactylos carnosus]CAF3916768.1 unnamed protein product [Didymodactylos carnosus]
MSSIVSKSVEILSTLSLAFIYSIYGIFLSILKLYKIGPKRFFNKIERSKPPRRALDSDYGTHEMMKLKTSGITLHYVSKGSSNQPLIVVAIDQRGYGLSSKLPSVSDYRAEVLAADIADMIQQLGHSCILVGHDWGGAICWMAAQIYPHLIEKLIIMNCPHPQAFRTTKSFAQIRRSWYMFFFQCPVIPEIFIHSDDFSFLEEAMVEQPMGIVNSNNIEKEDLEVMKYSFAQKGTVKAAINYYRASFRYRSKHSVHEPITVPTLLIWGVLDQALGEELADASTNYCHDIRLKKIPNASHWVQQDVPDLCHKYMDEFLNEETN